MRSDMNRWEIILGLAVLCIMVPSRAAAMHVSEGILPLQWAVFWFVLTIPFLFLGLRKIRIRSESEPHFKALIGLVGAAVFIISCMPIPVPTAGTCSHPCGTGMAAILIGPMPTTVIASVALTLQALFLAHGGLTTLGANIFSMGVVGAFSGYGVFLLLRKLGTGIFIAAFGAGLISDWMTYLATAFTLSTALQADGNWLTMFVSILLAFVPTQLPLGILEGFIAAGAYTFVHARRPEFFGVPRSGTLPTK